MSNDLYAERLRLVSGSSEWTIGAFAGSDPNSVRSEPTGSLVRASDGGLWINSNGGTEWLKFGAGSLTCSYTADGSEGSQVTVTLPRSFPDSNYRVFVTNVSGSSISAYQVPEHLRTSTNFKVNSSAPFAAFDKLDFLCISGTIYAGGAGSSSTSVTGTLSITSGSQANTNISTEGNIDWMVFINSSLNPPRAQASSCHSKRGGGWIRESFDWVFAGQSFSGASYTSTITKTTNQKDTIATSALSANTQASYFTSVANPSSGWGFHLRVPATTQTRVLRIATNHYSTVTVVSASLTDNSADPVSVIHTTGNSTSIEKVTTISFNASRDCELIVTYTVVANYTADVTCGFNWATLSGNL